MATIEVQDEELKYKWANDKFLTNCEKLIIS